MKTQMKKSELLQLIKEVVSKVLSEREMSGIEFENSLILKTNKGNYKFWAEEEREKNNRKWMYFLQKDDSERGPSILVPSNLAPTYPIGGPNMEKISKAIIDWINKGMPKK